MKHNRYASDAACGSAQRRGRYIRRLTALVFAVFLGLNLIAAARAEDAADTAAPTDAAADTALPRSLVGEWLESDGVEPPSTDVPPTTIAAPSAATETTKNAAPETAAGPAPETANTAAALPPTDAESRSEEALSILAARRPALDADGFLPEGEFLYEDPEGGEWRYASPTLVVTVIRHQTTKPLLIWYEAEVFAREDDFFHMIVFDPARYWTSKGFPYLIAQRNRAVLAITSDFAHHRIKTRNSAGIILRAGEIVKTGTKKRNTASFLPSLDTLALYTDGNMEVFYSDELTAQEYQDRGAYDVLSFGPYLVRDGEINARGVRKYDREKAPRTAIGMVEKGHYYCVMTEGRHKKSTGAGLQWLAQKMYDLGCQTAFNLDGGQSATMVFMGKQIITVGKTDIVGLSARKTAELVAIGTSELCRVPAE